MVYNFYQRVGERLSCKVLIMMLYYLLRIDLRLVKNILKSAKTLKLKHPRVDEKVILGQAIRFTTQSLLRPEDETSLEVSFWFYP